MIIVNFSTGHYLKGQERLKNSLAGYKTLMLSSYTAIGSPTHEQSPYEFKLHSIHAAWKFDPIALWMDASMWVVKDLSEIQSIIKQDGYFMTESGHYVSRWTNQFTQDYFHLTEKEKVQDSGGMTMISAGLLGFDKNSPIAQEFMRLWIESAKAGCFRGSHNDHRHDQSCASIIAQRMGMKYQRGGKFLSYIGPGYGPPEPESPIYLQGI